MKRVPFFVHCFVAQFIILLLFTSCGVQPAGERIDLSDGWQYSLENSENAVFTDLSAENLAHLETLVPDMKGVIYIKKVFDVPQSLQNQHLGCYLGRISLADRTYLNGCYIGGEGVFPPGEFSAWNKARFYEIPDVLLKPAQNVLIAEIFVDGEGSVVSSPFIGTAQDAEDAAAYEQFINSTINLLFAFFMIFIGLYHLLIYIRNRKEKESLCFSLINLVTAVYLCVFYYPDIPSFMISGFPFLLFQKLFSSSMLFIIVFILCSFVNAYFRRKEPVPVVVLRLLLLLVPVCLIFMAPDYVHLRSLRTWTNYVLIVPLVYVAVIVLRAVFKKQKDALPLAIGFSPFVFLSLWDVIMHDVLMLYELPYLSPYGWQLVIIALLFVLANRFSNARVQAEYLNVHLADEVAERTKELSASNEQLSLVNERLNEAKALTERDMKMAVHVQQSFLPRQAPSVDEWDAAFTFRPMSGVSGDLYDFFTIDGKLRGLALFDVSGHGIASGLVTMLAKSVIDRTFTADPQVHLSKVMTDINDGIVSEKGNVENYLTGVLLRITGDRVEYINAGHPAVYFRSGKSGKTYEVRTDASQTGQNCSLIGLDGMDVDFKVIGFNMQKGDSLILYTDCLSESRNAEGEQWGQEAVSRAFSECSGETARAKLDSVLDRFGQFTGDLPLKDDLTVIVLQKR